MKPIRLLGFPIHNVMMNDAVSMIADPAPLTPPVSFFFINAHCVNRARHDPSYRCILQHDSVNFADGIGMKLAAGVFNIQLVENVNGTDLFPLLCRRMQQDGLSVFFLGGKEETVRRLVQNTQQRYPQLRIAGRHHGYFTEEESGGIIETINTAGTDILLVALGVPKQEKWIQAHRHELCVKAALGVGGLFDFYSGRIPRAPRWMRRFGLEWCYRLWREPARLWKRYLLGNFTFLLYLLFYAVWVFALRRTQPSD